MSEIDVIRPQWIEKYLAPKWLIYLSFLLIIFTTLGLQSKKIGFEVGHHGWVSSHTLAIISNASLENGFVGYAFVLKDEKGMLHYRYFDRYPIFFGATLNQVLHFFSDLATKVYVARQIMNIFFLATFLAAFMLVAKLIDNYGVALSVVLITFSNYFLLYYKDMIHYDQPALLGFVCLLYAIAVYKFDGRKTVLYFAVFVALALGRGYASYSILFLWFVIESLTIIWSSDVGLKRVLLKILKQDSFIVLVLGILWGILLLSYNIHIEAHIRNVPYSEVSIVQSAKKRLLLDDALSQDYRDKLNWGNFSQDQIDRIANLVIPQGHRQLGALKYLILIPMVVVIPIMLIRASANKRVILLLMLLSGFVWLFPMRGLSAFHDYTLMYYIGIPLVFYMGLTSWFMGNRRREYVLLLGCLLLFIASNYFVNARQSGTSELVNDMTLDFDRIRQQIPESPANIFVENGYDKLIPGARYAVGFYMTGYYLTSLSNADYIISKNKAYNTQNMTPKNKEIFLFRKNDVGN